MRIVGECRYQSRNQHKKGKIPTIILKAENYIRYKIILYFTLLMLVYGCNY